MSKNKGTEVSNASNDGKAVIDHQKPYAISFTLNGTADMLFHRWSNEDVDAKAAGKKGSKEKKTDNVEAYVYRDDQGRICVPGEYVRQALVHAAKFKSDPRSPRKSQADLYKAAVVATTVLAPITVNGKPAEKWDYEDRRRVTIQRAGINRTRPAFKSGWEATFEFEIILPEYVKPDDFQETLTMAGRVIGIADFRPTYGRFGVKKFEVVERD